jgi:uncharacterized protein (TIGR02646 family)
MKHILKDAEPHELLLWKETDRLYLRGNPRWGRISSPIKGHIRENLKVEQGFICCYCERDLDGNDCHIEHILPKGLDQYKIFLADYDNLLCSCQFEQKNGDPRRCGNSKGSWYDEHLYVSPLEPNCESRFEYSFDGHINASNNEDQAAIITIQKLNLGLDKLNALRKAVIETFIDDSLTQEDVENLVNGYLVDKSLNDGKFNPFYTTIKFLFKI